MDSAILTGKTVQLYRITVTNEGIYPLTNVIITDDLPDFLIFGGSGFTPSLVDQNHIEWDVGLLNPGGGIQFIYTAFNLIPFGNEGYNNAYTEGNTGTGIVSDSDNVHIIC